MRLLFLGTPRFAAIALQRLLESRHKVEAVVTAPDKEKGRGRRLLPSDVKQFARSHDLEILQPMKLKDEGFLTRVRQLNADLLAVVAFRILPEKLFSIPPFGAINLHASLLPRYRGAAPIERALMDGATTTGVTTFQIKKKVDTGDILLSREVKIKDSDTYEDLYLQLAASGADLLVETLDGLQEGKLTPQAQDPALASPAPKITAEDSVIDWDKPAIQIVNQIRALAGSLDAHTDLRGKRLKILRAAVAELDAGRHLPGEIVAANRNDGLVVAAGSGAVKLLEVRLEGKKRLDIVSFLNGVRLSPGTQLAAS